MFRTKSLVTEIIRLVILLFAVCLLAFILITSAPIDPLTSYVGTESTLSPEAKQEIANYWGLNDPLPQRFFTWLGHLFQGDMGQSISFKRPVAQIIFERFTMSLALMIVSWVLSGIIGFFLGMACGKHEGSVFDRIVKTIFLGLKSAPTFWLGLIILTVFAVLLGWFPIGMASPIGKVSSEVTIADRLYHMVLPAFTLTIVSMGDVILYTRQKYIEIDRSDYILYAKTRGETDRQISRRHILRNIALPAITLQFASFSELFGGMALAENVFAYPGIGTATTAAAMNADVPLLLGISLISAIFVFSGNLIANILYGVFDPRLREGRKHG